MKLWGGRFNGEPDEQAWQFSSSLHVDIELLADDIEGSRAHAAMLHSVGLLNAGEYNSIDTGLQALLADYRSGSWDPLAGRYEDVHSAIEAELTRRIGVAAGKLHTGRSRNDQVATASRLWCMRHAGGLAAAAVQLQRAFAETALLHLHTLMPGYTHLQRAQTVSLGYHLHAYVAMFARDQQRFLAAAAEADCSPLGSGALAGSTLPLNPSKTAAVAGFSSVAANAMDAVSDRDYMAAMLHACSLTMLHLSRFAEDMVLWCSTEWGFAVPGDAVATGSSLMPQKKNPDIAELIRGKTARVLSHEAALKLLLKGLPLSYNRDLQEDKEPLFSGVYATLQAMHMAELVLRNTVFQTSRFTVGLQGSCIYATDTADWLVLQGVPFRQAHEVVGRVVAYCEQTGKPFGGLSVNELQQWSAAFSEGVLPVMRGEQPLERKITAGSPNPGMLRAVLEAKLAELGPPVTIPAVQ